MKHPKMPNDGANTPVIVGVGASAGGLKALEVFFSAMPADSGCSFIIVQHLSPDFKSLMDELLARHTKMQIKAVMEGAELEPNIIYLTAPKMLVSVHERRFALTQKKTGQNLEMPINGLFTALSREYGPQAIGVVLSGTGSDGSEGGACDPQQRRSCHRAGA